MRQGPVSQDCRSGRRHCTVRLTCHPQEVKFLAEYNDFALVSQETQCADILVGSFLCAGPAVLQRQTPGVHNKSLNSIFVLVLPHISHIWSLDLGVFHSNICHPCCSVSYVVHTPSLNLKTAWPTTLRIWWTMLLRKRTSSGCVNCLWMYTVLQKRGRPTAMCFK